MADYSTQRANALAKMVDKGVIVYLAPVTGAASGATITPVEGTRLQSYGIRVEAENRARNEAGSLASDKDEEWLVAASGITSEPKPGWWFRVGSTSATPRIVRGMPKAIGPDPTQPILYRLTASVGG